MDEYTHADMVDLFFTGSDLANMISYFCKISVAQSRDPIADTVVVMISSPLVVMLTQVGLAPFKNNPSYVYPYKFLSDIQREFLKGFVQSITDNAATGVVSMQVGGGCILYKKSSTRNPVYLDSYNVITSLCNGIIGNRSKNDHRNRIAVCNVILQRIGGVVHIDRSIMSRVALHLQSFKGDTPMLERSEMSHESQSHGNVPELV
jgi:hypothetical protein